MWIPDEIVTSIAVVANDRLKFEAFLICWCDIASLKTERDRDLQVGKRRRLLLLIGSDWFVG